MNKKLHNPKAHAPAVYIPCWLIQIPNKLLSYSAKILYGRLAQWSTSKGQVYRSVPQLSKELGTEKRQIDRYIKELKDVGLIGTFHPQKGGVNHFQFYDHEWMYQPIIDELSYADDPTTNLSLPHDKNDVTPTTNLSSINIKEIKRNKINNKGTSSEAPNVSYTQVDKNEDFEKSDYPGNQHERGESGLQPLVLKMKQIKSDYFENKTNKCADSKSINLFELKDILSENIFQIPEQIIQDWIANRIKKRAPVTKTAWNKINKELAKCKEQDIDPIEAFETMVAGGWQSMKVEYFITKESLTKQEAAKKRSIELEQRAARQKEREIEEAKRLSKTTSKSDQERYRLRKLLGARAPDASNALN